MKLEIEIITADEPKVSQRKPPQGWGDAKSCVVSGEHCAIVVSKDGEAKLDIRVLDDGTLWMCRYGSGNEVSLGGIVQMVPGRKWITSGREM